MARLLPNMNILYEEERSSITSFCSYVSENKDNLSEYKKGVVADYIISSVVCKNVKYLNNEFIIF